ncbi:MAG: hypothetical protein BWY55_00020 [archaeon ADurb.Bin336]|nr:MAG: hypothetical protein BWY55_00020 [archaeon ADurb.Bin336]
MKRLLFLFISVLFLGSVFAFTAPLTDFGFKEISTSVMSEKKCETIVLNLNESDLNKEGVGLLSLNAFFGGEDLDNTYISVSINGEEELLFWKEFFYCGKEDCWARIYVPQVVEGETSLKICASLGGNTSNMKVIEKSFFGFYDIPLLKIRNEAPSQIFLGDRAKMSIIVSNEGTEPASIYVQFVQPDTRAKVNISSFDIVEGDSSASTYLMPGETKKFDYYIKPSLISSYNLPSAALFFTNNFGEEQVLISNHPTLSVVKPNKLNLALIVSEEENENRTFKVIIKNNSDSSFTGELRLYPQTKVIDSVKSVFVSARGEQEVFFESVSFEGKENFFVSIIDGNEIYYSNTLEVENHSNNFSFLVIIAVCGILAGGLIFAWIYYSKK